MDNNKYSIIKNKNSTIKYFKSGQIRWYNNQHKLHRVDGPAVKFANGKKEWWGVHGKKHRLNGPAIMTFINIKW